MEQGDSQPKYLEEFSMKMQHPCPVAICKDMFQSVQGMKSHVKMIHGIDLNRKDGYIPGVDPEQDKQEQERLRNKFTMSRFKFERRSKRCGIYKNAGEGI